MIAGECNRCGDPATGNGLVHRQRKPAALTVAKPSDARRQSRELHVLARLADPRRDRMVGREHLKDHVVDGVDILRIARHGDPAERADPFAKQRPDIKVHERTHSKGIRHARGFGFGPQAVAIFEHDCTAIHEPKHGAEMHGYGLPRERNQLLWIAPAHRVRFFEREFGGHVALERVGKRLIGDNVRQDAEPRKFGQDDGRVRTQRQSQRTALVSRGKPLRYCIIEVIGGHIAIAAGNTTVDTRLIDLDYQRRCAREFSGKRLRSAHPAAAGRQQQPTGERAAEMLAANCREGLKGALQYPWLPIYCQAAAVMPGMMVSPMSSSLRLLSS